MNTYNQTMNPIKHRISGVRAGGEDAVADAVTSHYHLTI